MAYELNHTPGGRHSVTAFFDRKEAAEKARADLLAAGYPADDVVFVPGAEAAIAAAPAHRQGILKSLLDIFVFMPPHDQLTYTEGLRRGGMALAVRTGPDGYERAIDILDRDGAVDLDERETNWRNEGWATEPDSPRQGGPGSSDQAGFERTNRHDPLVNAAANKDVRERIGVGTSDVTVGTDLEPPNALTGSTRADVPDQGGQGATMLRDTTHGRRRVRSYIAGPLDTPGGTDPQV